MKSLEFLKRKFSSILLVIITLLLFSCGDGTFFSSDPDAIVPSDNVTTEDRTLSNYSKLDVSSIFKVYVQFSETEEKIEIEANENLQEIIIVEKENDKLIIRLKDNTSINGDVTLNAFITTKSITEYYGSGVINIFLEDKLIANNAKINLTGAGTFNGNMDVNNLEVNLSGSTAVNLTGSTEIFQLKASGSSVIEDYFFSTDVLDIDFSGASLGYLTVNEKINIKATGASSLFYKGNAIIDEMNLSGVSVIKKVD